MEDKGICMMFPGIGSDYRKSLKKTGPLFRRELRNLAKRAESQFGIRIMDYLESEEQKETHVDLLTSWSSNYTCDYLAGAYLIQNGVAPRAILGYSMGLITGLAWGGAICYEDGILLLKTIIDYHKNGDEEEMATIVGLYKEDLQRIIRSEKEEEQVSIACENHDYCFVLSGKRESVLNITEACQKAGAVQSRVLNSGFAFHTESLRRGIGELEACISKMEIRPLKIPVLSAIDQNVVTSGSQIRRELIQNMYSVMQWQKSIETIRSEVDGFAEAGLSKALSRLTKVIAEEKTYYTYDRVEGIV